MDKIICLGKNYAEHIQEMKEVTPTKPVLFLKPPSVLREVKNNDRVKLPWEKGEIHFETEVVFKLYKKNIIGLALGLDLTLRNIQKNLKQLGHPWEISKVFKNSALVTETRGLRDFSDWQQTPFSLSINGAVKQEANISQAILKPDEIIHHIDTHFPICDGDLVFTGTPAGVGPLHPEDELILKFGPIETKFRLVEFG